MITTITVVVTASIITYTIYEEEILKHQIEKLENTALTRGNSLDILTSFRIQQGETLSRMSEIHEVLKSYSDEKVSSSEQARNELLIGELKEKIVNNKILIPTKITGSAQYHEFEIIDKSGVIVYSDNPDNFVKTVDTTIFANPSMTYGYDSDKNRAMIISHPIRDHGKHSEIIGYLKSTMGTTTTDSILLNREKLGKSSETYLVDFNKKMISESRFIKDAPFKITSDTKAVNHCINTGQSMTGEYLDYRGIPIFGSSYCANEYGWVLLVEIDSSELRKPLEDIQKQMAIIAIVTTIIAIIIGVTVSRSITKPINSLRDKVIRFGASSSSSSSSSSSYTGQSEIEILDKEFENMKQSVVESTEDMKTFKQILDKAALVSQTDLKGNITYANEEFCKISGYSKEELIGKNHRILKSGKHDEIFYRTIWETITKGKVWEGNICNKSKDGSLYWVHSIISPNKAANNDGYTSIRINITKQVEFEQNQADFIHMASHELRTPIQPLLNLADMHEIGIIDSKEMSEKIRINAERLQEITEDMLEISRIEAGAAKYTWGEMDVKKSINNIVAKYSSKLSEDTKIITNIDEITITADRLKVEQIIENVLGNAVKFTAQGQIEITAKKDDGECTITISDSGTGIDKEILSKLFTKFATKAAPNSEQKGTGLGLYLSREYARGHGGDIVGKNNANGAGATFTITLLISPPPPDNSKEYSSKL